MAVSTALFAVATGASRLVGMLREAAAAWIFTVQGEAINAFTVAYQIPNLIRSLVADAALGAAFVPIFNELLDEGRARARLARGLDRLVAVVRGALGGHGDRDRARAAAARAVRLSRLARRRPRARDLPDGRDARPERPADRDPERARRVLPAGHRARGLEHRDRRHAGAQPAVPAHDRHSASTPTPSASCSARPSSSRSRIRRCGGSGASRWFCDPRDEAVQRVFSLMLPVTLGLGLINLNLLVNTWFAAGVDKELGPAAVDKAFRIYMLPQGMFSVAVAAVLFPALSRRAADRDGPGFRALVGSGLRQIAFLLIPAAAICAALATPIVRLLYEHGRFTPGEHGDRRLVPGGVLARARLQRRDAAAQPRLLQHAARLGADLRRDRQPGRQRHARLGALEPAGHLEHPARDLDREHRRRRAALPRAAPARRPPRRARAGARARAHRAWRPRWPSGPPTACGAGSTRCSASSS